MKQGSIPAEILARGPEALKAYEEALESGKTKHRRLVVMVVGPARAGKTSLLKSFNGGLFDQKEDSTNGIQLQHRVCKSQENCWSKDNDEGISYTDCMADVICQKLRGENDKRSAEASKGPSDDDDDHGANTTSRKVPKSIEEKVLDKLKETEIDWNKENELHIKTVDFAGQAVYNVIHPIFLTSKAVFILVYNLKNILHDPMKSKVQKYGLQRELVDPFEMTNLENLEVWLSCISSYTDARKTPKVDGLSLPPVFIAGTHADEFDGKLQAAKHIIRQIYKSLSPSKNPSGFHVKLDKIYTVDNSVSGNGEIRDESVIQLKADIEKLSKSLPHMKEDIPLTWLWFEEELSNLVENENKRYITIDEAMEIARACRVNTSAESKEFTTLLKYLHDLKSVIYFEETKLVFIDIKWLVTVFTKVIEVTPFVNRAGFDESWDKLEEEGVLERALVEHVWKGLVDEQNTIDALLLIMETFSLICRWSTSEREDVYLVPSMLGNSEKRDDIANVLNHEMTSTMVIRFSTPHVSLGIFPRLFVCIAEEGKKIWPNLRQPKLRKNFCRIFSIGKERNLDICIIQLSPRTISVTVCNEQSIAGQRVTEFCQHFRELLDQVFDDMRRNFPWMQNMTFEYGILCPVCARSSNKCKSHGMEGCTRDSCLHFVNEEELTADLPVECDRDFATLDNVIEEEAYSHWFPRHLEGTIPTEILARGPEALKAYEEALESGKTKNRRFVVMVVGPARAGKTSLLKSFNGEKFDERQDSTKGIQLQHTVCRLQENCWSKDSDRISYTDCMANFICQKLDKKNAIIIKSVESSYSLDQKNDVDDGMLMSKVDDDGGDVDGGDVHGGDADGGDIDHDHDHDGNDVHNRDDKTTSSKVESLNEKTNKIENKEHLSKKSTKKRLPHSIQEKVSEKTKDTKSAKMKENEWYIETVDFAGQAVYNVIHPIFLTSKAVFILVYNLKNILHEPMKSKVEKDGLERELVDPFEMTNLENLELWLSCISSYTDAQKMPQVEGLSLPPVFIVGTHADEFEGKLEAAKQIIEQIYKALSPSKNPSGCHVKLKEEIYTVDNSVSGNGEIRDESVIQLKADIEELSKSLPHMKKHIPLTWLWFEEKLSNLVEKENKKYITIDKAKEIAKECKVNTGVDSKGFTTLLNYLHDLKSVIYFEETELVFIDTKWLVEVFTKVIEVTPFVKRDGLHKSWDKLEEDGVLERALVEHVWKGLVDEQNTIESLLLIMEKFSLICRWRTSEGEDVYLVPAMLCNSKEREDIGNVLNQQTTSTMAIRFNTPHLSLGIFPRLFIAIAEEGTKKWSNFRQPKLRKNFCRMFCIGKERNLDICIIQLSPRTISVTVCNEQRIAGQRVTEFCQHFRELLDQVFDDMRRNFPWMQNMTFEYGILCPVCARSSNKCKSHGMEGCSRDSCLHFVNEEELISDLPAVCNVDDILIKKEAYSYWFPRQVADTSTFNLDAIQSPKQKIGCVEERVGNVEVCSEGYPEPVSLSPSPPDRHPPAAALSRDNRQLVNNKIRFQDKQFMVAVLVAVLVAVAGFILYGRTPHYGPAALVISVVIGALLIYVIYWAYMKYSQASNNFALPYRHEVSVSDLKTTIGLEHSVGAIIARNVSNVKKCGATCFRIGTEYVITNHHVVLDIVNQDYSWRDCYVDFNYEEQGPQPADWYRFHFAPNPVLVFSEELDYAILRLNPEGRNLPPSVIDPETKFNIAPPGRQFQGGECLTFIGHPGGLPKQINVSCPIKPNQTSEAQVRNPNSAFYDVSTFFEGSSGSPGFLMQEKLLSVLHRRGHGASEEGTLMASVVEDVMLKINNGTIQNVQLDDIFDGLTSSTFDRRSPEPMDIDYVPGL